MLPCLAPVPHKFESSNPTQKAVNPQTLNTLGRFAVKADTVLPPLELCYLTIRQSHNLLPSFYQAPCLLQFRQSNPAWCTILCVASRHRIWQDAGDARSEPFAV